MFRPYYGYIDSDFGVVDGAGNVAWSRLVAVDFALWAPFDSLDSVMGL